jgi:hypothetical protein|nr:MAG TPA: replication initiator protein [Caudoviricetes sp.]
MENDFNYYTENEVYGALFLKFPRALLYGEKYKKLSSDAKIAYMALKDRLEYSLKNHWVDEEDHVYFIFTNKELGQVINRTSPHTIKKIKNELVELGLLKDIQQGVNKPNKMYLSNLDLQANEVYQIDPDFSAPGNAKNAIPQNADITGNAKNANPVISRNKDAGSLDNSGNAKNAHNLDLDLTLDTYIDTKDTLKGDSNSQSQSASSQNQNPEYERMLLNNYAETKMSGERGVSFLGSKLLTFIAARANSIAEADNMVDHIIKAKQSVEKEHKGKIVIEYDLENRQNKMFKTLSRVLSNEKGGKVDSLLAYLFTSFKRDFEEMIEEEESIDKKSIYEGTHNPLADYRIPMIDLTKKH